MSPTHTDDAFELVELTCNAVLIFVIARKSRWRDFPMFTLLSFYVPIQDIVLNAASQILSRRGYRHFYWTFAVGDFGIQLALMGEITRKALRPTYRWITNARSMFFGLCTVGFVFVAIFVLISVSSVADVQEFIYRRGSLFTSLLTCICLLALSITANRFGLPRKDHVRAIAQGLASWNTISIIGDVLLATGLPAGEARTLDHTRMIVWDLALLYWAKSLWRPELARGDWSLPASLKLAPIAQKSPADMRES